VTAPYPKWRYFPAWEPAPPWALSLVAAVHETQTDLDRTLLGFRTSDTEKSNVVLAVLRPNLESLGYEVERGKRREDKISRPVFFEEGGKATKTFDVDAFHLTERVGMEVEYGRVQPNNAVYKDLVELCLMVDVDYGALLVPLVYRTTSHPYEHAVKVLQPIFASPRLNLPLKGFLLVGY
jgi:hypothetical protein